MGGHALLLLAWDTWTFSRQMFILPSLCWPFLVKTRLFLDSCPPFLCLCRLPSWLSRFTLDLADTPTLLTNDHHWCLKLTTAALQEQMWNGYIWSSCGKAKELWWATTLLMRGTETDGECLSHYFRIFIIIIDWLYEAVHWFLSDVHFGTSNGSKFSIRMSKIFTNQSKEAGN